MNGQIWASNNDNLGGKERRKGSTFSFYLPLVVNNNNDNTSPKSKEMQLQSLNKGKGPISSTPANAIQSSISSSSSSSAFDLNVLIVDDTLINRKVFDRMLKRIGIASVVTADSGIKALTELSTSSFDLVITDLQMPGMSGTELSDAIRSKNYDAAANEKQPVVIGLTADTGMDVRDRCAASGMADILYKPITVVEMSDYFARRVHHLEPGIWLDDEKT